jgi:putative transport protein
MGLGSIKIKGIGLGSSGVLFVGILAAQFSQPVDAATLTFVKEFGLVLFVFTIGLSLGPGFFASLRAEGLRLNVLAAVLVLAAGILAPLVGSLVGLDAEAVAGLFAGASTNTPALGAAQQSLAALPGMTAERLALPALACAVSYPAAIAGSLGAILALRLLFRIDPAQEAQRYAAERSQAVKPLLRRTLLVNKPEMWAIFRELEDGVVISRLRRAREAEVQTAHRDTELRAGDTILAVGTAEALDRLERMIGPRSDEDLMAAPGKVTFRRIVVTHRRVLGKTVAELGFEARLGVEVTRIVRGDVEMTAVPSLRLAFGDVLANRRRRGTTGESGGAIGQFAEEA